MSLRKIIFWSHLLACVSAGLIIFSMSFTGVVLMYEPQISGYSERSVRWVAPSANAKRLSYDELIAKVRQANPKAQPGTIMIKSDPRSSVSVSFARETTLFVNPYNGEILGGQSPTHNFLRDVVEWHRWLGVDGEGRASARAITGACNLAFFWLAITGVYLWWPPSWHWRALKHSFLFNPRLRGKARDWNWHNVIGFWSSSVLIFLTLTAAVMSYSWANDLLYKLTGSEPPRRADGPGAAAEPARRGRQRTDVRAARSTASVDFLLARAQEQVPGWMMITLRFTPSGDGSVTASIQGPDAFHPFQRSQLTLDRATGAVIKWEPYAGSSAGRKLRTWVRALHTGEAFGFAGQTAAGFASFGGCFLVWTGLVMAWRRVRSWQHKPEDLITTPILSKVTEGKISMPGTSLDSEPVECSPASYNGDAVLILYGTVTGNAEILANKAANMVRRIGRSARVHDMAHCPATVLNETSCVLVVTSTYGDGEPPEDAASFWQAVVHGNGLDLRGVRFSVLALGNKTFDHFCKCGRDLDAALERHGATRFYPRVDCDVDYELAAMHWIYGVVTNLSQEKTTADTQSQ